MVFVLQIGGRFPLDLKAKVTAEKVGNVSDAQAIIYRKALKQEKIVKMVKASLGDIVGIGYHY